jgi:hypothetical protein
MFATLSMLMNVQSQFKERIGPLLTEHMKEKTDDWLSKWLEGEQGALATRPRKSQTHVSPFS